MSTTFVWAVPMAVVAVTCEYLYRRLPTPWVLHWPMWIPLHLLMGYLVYRVVVSADSLLAAFIVGNLCTSVARIAVTTLLLREAVSPGTWAGFGLLVLANAVRAWWR